MKESTILFHPIVSILHVSFLGFMVWVPLSSLFFPLVSKALFNSQKLIWIEKIDFVGGKSQPPP